LLAVFAQHFQYFQSLVREQCMLAFSMAKQQKQKNRLHFSYRNRFNPTSAFYNAEVGLKEMSRSIAGLGVLLILLLQILSHYLTSNL
jgi:hypothetical protein